MALPPDDVEEGVDVYESPLVYLKNGAPREKYQYMLERFKEKPWRSPTTDRNATE